MPLIHFSNPGVLPIQAITILGLSVKEKDNPIGKFGTGLKYTIAGILRLGGTLSIETGGKKFYFESNQVTVRGKVFDQVSMVELDGPARELGFTTDLGKHWQPWMHLRELISNCLDEGGSYGWGEGEPPAEDATRIIVASNEHSQAFTKKDEFILSTLPIEDIPGVGSIHVTPSGISPGVFFQGIRVFSPASSLYTYNITDPEYSTGLSEDRTMHQWYAEQGSRNILIRSHNSDTIKAAIFNVDDTSFEAGFEYGSWIEHQEDAKVFRETAYELYDKDPFLIQRRLRSALDITRKPKLVDQFFTLSSVEQKKFDRACDFLVSIGFEQAKNLSWKFILAEETKLYGMVRDGSIYLTKAAFDMGTQFLAQTMVEEYCHFIFGVEDYTRGFQDLLLKKLVALGEELLGEAL